MQAVKVDQLSSMRAPHSNHQFCSCLCLHIVCFFFLFNLFFACIFIFWYVPCFLYYFLLLTCFWKYILYVCQNWWVVFYEFLGMSLVFYERLHVWSYQNMLIFKVSKNVFRFSETLFNLFFLYLLCFLLE